MDFSNEYIKMCKKAIEIQHIWRERITEGKCEYDFVYYYDPKNKYWGEAVVINKGQFGFVIVEPHCFVNYPAVSWQQEESNYIWLPRQDQLQDIFCQEYECSRNLWTAFYDFIIFNEKTKKYIEHNLGYRDPNVLWLAFVMYMLYNKMWAGNDWIPFKDQ